MELPESWAKASIRDVTSPIAKTQPRDFPNSPIRYIDIAGIDSETNSVTAWKDYLGKDAPSRARQVVQVNDILFSTVRTYLKNIARVPANLDGEVASTGFSILRAADGVESDFLFYLSLTPAFLEPLNDLQRGSSYPAVRDSDVRDHEIPLPPLNEQKRIVAKIEELFSELDAGEASLRQARRQLGLYRQSLLQQAFQGHLTASWREENPERSGICQKFRPQPDPNSEDLASSATERESNPVANWTKSTLGEITEFITSGSRGWAKFYAESGDLFIRAQNLNRDCLNIDDAAFVHLPQKAEGTRTRVQFGDVLVTITGANTTKTGWVNRELGSAFVSQHVALCRLKDPKMAPFVYLFVIAPTHGRKILEKAAYGAGKPGLNLDNLRTLPIPIPSLPEQQEIVRLLEAQFEVIEQNEREIDAALKRSEALRQSILHRAFSGQLVPQDPNDEPASELLARIQAERATAAAESALKAKAKKPKKRARTPKKASTPVQDELF